MSKPDYTEIIKILEEYGVPLTILDDDVLINTYEPKDIDEYMHLMNALYIAADRKSPTKTRTPADIDKIDNIGRIIARNITERQAQQNESNLYSESLQNWADPENNKTIGGKSCVFRRKNKTTRSKSRRNVRRTQHTRTHQKSSTRRSTRK